MAAQELVSAEIQIASSVIARDSLILIVIVSLAMSVVSENLTQAVELETRSC